MRILIAAAALGLMACQPGADAPAKAQTPGVDASQAEGAEAFVRETYAAYHDDPNVQSGGSDAVWSARTKALWDENFEAAQGVGYLGFDPVCNCQDWTRLHITALTVTPTGTDSADAAVTFVNGDPAATVNQTLKLVREGGAWAIDDIVWGPGATVYGEPNMVEGLIASTAEIKAMPEELR